MPDISDRVKGNERQSAPSSSETYQAETYGVFGSEDRQRLGTSVNQMLGIFRTGN